MNAWVSVININNDIKEPTRGYQDYNTNQDVTFGKLSRCENLYTPLVIIWVNVMLDGLDFEEHKQY